MGGRRGDKRLVIGFFESRAAGLEAARAVTDDVSMGDAPASVAILGLDAAGHPRVSEPVDPAGDLGGVLGVIASALRGGVMPARRLFFETGADLGTDDVVRFGVELEAGHVAVASLEPATRADRIVVRLVTLGGKTESHRFTLEALRAVAATAAAS